MTTLPELHPRLIPHENSSSICEAYRRIQELEKATTTDTQPEHLIYARILGYLMLEGPTDQAGVTMAQGIISCVTDTDIFELGKKYMHCYLRVLMSRRPTHFDSSEVSRPSYDAVQGMLKTKLFQAPEDHQTAKRDALIRDGYRCPLTGAYDRTSLKSYPEVRRMALEAAKPAYRLHCAHIFPNFVNDPSKEAVSTTDTIKQNQGNYAASVHEVLRSFGYVTLFDDLSGRKIHRLDNILILDPVAHDHFDHLELWFEPMPGREDTYHVRYSDSIFSHKEWKTEIKFTSPDPELLPLPNPEYLKLHASCARVAHLSGAGKYIEELSGDLEDSLVLAEDGGSAGTLEYALTPWANT
ncbi:hypothetical protein NP233_g7959 [Leucocoprinus birnbaumii]|uniref:HNH nuclease domain-containing protein n=1 Tax=Leucocoprinus birnbaumii TaxID=56174 RepID=A0AAD5YNJ0_9AGAR|nr:hypothetical protein NP233_g7959 [Leucocoprinus birnbaumii]